MCMQISPAKHRALVARKLSNRTRPVASSSISRMLQVLEHVMTMLMFRRSQSHRADVSTAQHRFQAAAVGVSMAYNTATHMLHRQATKEPCQGNDDCVACAEASPRVRLTPHGIVHMGLSSASPTALQRWQSRRTRSGASPKHQHPQPRHAAFVEATAESHGPPTQYPASGSGQGTRGSAQGPDNAQADHLPGSPSRPPAELSSSGAARGLPHRPLPDTLKAHPSMDHVQHSSSSSLQAELELTGIGECRDMNNTQMGADSSRSLQTEAPEDEELLSLRPTRDFVEHFNQHTSFHRRKIMRSTKKGDVIPGTGSWPSPPLCGPCLRGLLDLSHCRLTPSMVMQPCIDCQPMSTEPELIWHVLVLHCQDSSHILTQRRVREA